MQPKRYGINRRLFIALLIQLAFFFTLLVRMFYLQIKEGFRFGQLADQNRTSLVPVIPKRGLMKDFLGSEIAGNGFFWEALIIKSEIKPSIEVFLNNIEALLYLTKKDQERIAKDYKNNPAYYPITLKNDLSDSEAAALEVFSPNLPGVFLRPFYKRVYPYKEALSHLLGYVSLSTDIKRSNGVPNWYLGRTGVEFSMDSFLKGDVGFLKYEVNAYGKIIRRLEQLSSKQGNSIALTINAKLQNDTYQILAEYNSASVIVSDISNGNILTLCSYPSFDPTLFSEGISTDTWKELTTDEKSPLNNKPLLGTYQPGSTIKSIIILKALQMGLIDENTKVDCPGYLKIGRDRFNCWKHGGHGKMNVMDALVQSCDVFFYQLAKQMSVANINEVATDFGFANKHLPLLSNENKGSVLPTSNMTLGDVAVSIIGQGKWRTTPLQLNKLISDIASNGVVYPFNILKHIEYEDKIIYPKVNKEKIQLKYSAKHFDLIKEALLKSVTDQSGTSKYANTQDPTWQLAGKSGTTQVRRITQEERNQNNGRAIPNHLLPWNKRDHALFVGFVPYNNPTYAITVVVDHGGSGGAVAGSIAKKIALILKSEHERYTSEKNRVNNLIKNTGT